MQSASHQGYRILTAAELDQPPISDFASAVLEGLSERPKRLSARFLYDDVGSDLFQDIMALDEYYPTRCEAEILKTHGPSLAARFEGQALNLVDLGAGDGAKTLQLLRHLQAVGAEVTYVPIDISEAALRAVTATIGEQMPALRVEGLVAEYTDALHWLTTQAQSKANLVLFLGSNIGNFNKAQARTFLRRLWSVLNAGDRVLVGFDLKKDIDLLLNAYNDAKGVTAAFNLNLLTRINRELGGHFDCSTFRHYSTYDVFSGAMESYLVSMVTQSVAVDALEMSFDFEAWESVHTEYSYKYLPSDIEDLANITGFELEASLNDARQWFVDSLWRVRK